jgi:HAMP domain-containing protein
MYEEHARIHFWFVQPVRDRDQTIGYVTHQRRIAAGANTQRVLQELSGGDSVTLYYRNIDGSYWTSMSGQPMAPLERIDTARARGPKGADVLYREERIGATPLMVGMYLPTTAVLVRPRATMRTVLLLSLVLLLGGAITSWLIGRSVARPLGELTRAAGMLATGDYAVRVPERGEVEVRRLAQTFNHMAAEIGASREALEHQKIQAESPSS